MIHYFVSFFLQATPFEAPRDVEYKAGTLNNIQSQPLRFPERKVPHCAVCESARS